MISVSTQNMIPKIQDYLETKPIIKAWLFGSCSRGDETPDSDVDLLVEFDKSSKVSLLKYAGFVCDLEELLDRKVDLVENGYLMDFASQTADNDKILIYERTI